MAIVMAQALMLIGAVIWLCVRVEQEMKKERDAR